MKTSPTNTSRRSALLLINLGTPDSPRPEDVRRYLRQFLLDPRVIDVAGWKRQLIVRLFILPRRPRQAAKAYQKIWTEAGSPLLVESRALQAKVQRRLGDQTLVELAMRYGQPSIEAALGRLRDAGIDRIVALPLYPQYASSTTGSSVEALLSAIAPRINTPFVQVVPPFYDHPAYIDALASVAGRAMARIDPDHVIFSYHGLPERHCIKSDDTGEHCLRRDDCCERIVAANRNCYRAHCFETTRLLTRRLEIADNRHTICFQSRLGREPWLRPYTDEVLVELAQQGVRRAAILSPAFVADCLETLEELQIRGAELFREHGGETLTLIPALNDDDAWADAVVRIARDTSAWLQPAV